MKTFLLEIVTPEKIAFSKTIESVTAPASNGEITILPHHVPLFTSLLEGEVCIRQGDEEAYLAIGGGFLEVTPDKCTILVTRAVRADELDEKAILKAQKQAEKALKESPAGEDLKIAQRLFRSTLVDLKVLRRRKSAKSR